MKDVCSLLIPLTTVDDDLRYEGESWQEQTNKQEDQGQVEMFHCQWFNFLVPFFLFEWNLIDQLTSQELKMSNFLNDRYAFYLLNFEFTLQILQKCRLVLNLNVT